MARNVKNIFKLIDIANNELPIEEQFLQDLKASIEKQNDNHKPSQTYKPSGMNCSRAMVYQVLGVEPDQGKASYQLTGICDSGTDRHIRMQKAIQKMKENINADCEYIDVADFVKQRNLTDIEIVGQSGMETKLYNKKYNMSFMCDGIIKYKSKYFVFEFKTETADKFYRRTDVDPSHYNQSTSYSINFELDNVLFLYENRNTCDLKAYIRNVTDKDKEELIGLLTYCDEYVQKLKAPPKPQDVSRKSCTYCVYRKQCERDMY